MAFGECANRQRTYLLNSLKRHLAYNVGAAGASRVKIMCLLVMICGLIACDERPHFDADAGMNDSGSACREGVECTDLDATRCDGSVLEKCTRVDDCLVWSTVETCDTGVCYESACHECGGVSGGFFDQVISVDGQTRHYYLNVPSSYVCGQAAPLWVDFHGTGSLNALAGQYPETNFGQQEILSVATEQGAIVVRPRSLSRKQGAQDIYQWDTTPTDEAQNVRFTEVLVEDLEKRFTLSREKRFASGFSTGSNMVLNFAKPEHRHLFRGLAPFGGGVWGSYIPVDTSWFQNTDQAVYFYTGLRDLHHPYANRSRALLSSVIGSEGRVWYRVSHGVHDLRSWSLAEMWDFWDERTIPAKVSTLDIFVELDHDDPQWSAVTSLFNVDDTSFAATTTDGKLHVVNYDEKPAVISTTDILTGVGLSTYQTPAGGCVDGMGTTYIASGSSIAQLTDGSWSVTNLDVTFSHKAGLNHMVDANCETEGVFLGGASDLIYLKGDGSPPQSLAPTDPDWLAPIFVNGGSDGGASTKVLAAPFAGYLVETSDGSVVDKVNLQDYALDIVAVADGYVVVGHNGLIVNLKLTLDTLEVVQSRRIGEHDWSRVAVSPDGLGVAAVAPTGGVALSADGGKSWTLPAPSNETPLHDALWLSDTKVVFAGEAGVIFALDVDA